MNDGKKSKIIRLRQQVGPDWYDLYPFRTNEHGVDIINSQSLFRLGLNDSFSTIHYARANSFLDFKTVYKYPDLKLTGYDINLTVSDWTHYSDEEEFAYEQAMKLEEIKIKFPKETSETLLTTYLDSKVSQLEHVAELQYILNEMYDEEPEEKFKGINSFNSKTVGKILSSDYKLQFSKIGDRINMEIIGNQWIFESSELLDQLIVATLIQCARRKHPVAHELLLVLLQYDIKKLTLDIFEGTRIISIPQETEEVIATAQQFLSRVILDDVNLSKRFRFVPSTKQSLRHFLIGEGKISHGGWIPKIQEYFSDSILPNYIQESKKRFDPKNSKEELELNNIEDETSARDFNQDVLRAQTRKKIGLLPERDAEMLRMRFVDDLTLDQIGNHFSIKKSYVSKILKRSIKDLRQQIQVN